MHSIHKALGKDVDVHEDDEVSVHKLLGRSTRQRWDYGTGSAGYEPGSREAASRRRHWLADNAIQG